MNHIEKLSKISEVVKGTLNVLFNPHLLTTVPGCDNCEKQVPATTEEYLRMIEKVEGRAIFINFGESREIRRHIVKINKMVEMHFELEVGGEVQQRYFAHYDIALLIDEVWGFLELLGKVENAA